MIIRVMSDTNFFDIEPKDPISNEELMAALRDMSVLGIEDKEGNIVFINPVNIIALEILNIPPIQRE